MDGYKILTDEEAIRMAGHLPGLFHKDARLAAGEIGDGNLNMVFRVYDEVSGRSVILKQAIPHLRVVGDSWPLTIDRARIEAEALEIQGRICPGLVPEVFHFDRKLAVIVMEDLSHLKLMRHELMDRKSFSRFPVQMGTFLAKTLFHTSDLAMAPMQKKELVRKFVNPELCKITEDLIFTHPFHNASSNDINPELAEEVERLWNNDRVLVEAAKLKGIFMTKAQCLIHGDLHTGSIFIDEMGMKVFDAEFAFYGPGGFDMGLLIGNLLLNYASWSGRDEIDRDEREAFRSYILHMIAATYEEFQAVFSGLWESGAGVEYCRAKGYLEYYLSDYLKEAIGFAGCEIIRRVVGLAHVKDLQSIPDLKKRAAAQRLALRLGQKMLERREESGPMQTWICRLKEWTEEMETSHG